MNEKDAVSAKHECAVDMVVMADMSEIGNFIAKRDSAIVAVLEVFCCSKRSEWDGENHDGRDCYREGDNEENGDAESRIEDVILNK